MKDHLRSNAGARQNRTAAPFYPVPHLPWLAEEMPRPHGSCVCRVWLKRTCSWSPIPHDARRLVAEVVLSISPLVLCRAIASGKRRASKIWTKPIRSRAETKQKQRRQGISNESETVIRRSSEQNAAAPISPLSHRP